MSKPSLSILSFATLVCMMLFATVSCKKDDPNCSESSNDFFVNVDFLPEMETNGKVAPRLMINYNDEAVMIELRRPSTSIPMESVLFLFPDNKATMMCGNDNLMVCAEYDMETLTPSDDVLLVIQMDDNALLLTKCVMDWTTNIMTKGDQMVLPIDGTKKKQAGKGGEDDDMRWFFFNRFIKPLTEKLDQLDNFYTIFNVPQGIVVTYIKAIISTTTPIILFSDDPEEFIDAMEYPITSYTETAVQTGLLHFVPQNVSDMASRVLAGIGWFTNGGHGTVDENEGNGEANKLPFSTFFAQSTNASNAASQIDNLEPVFTVKLYVFDVTENSAKFRGSLQYNNTNTSPVEMGYIYKVSGGTEHTVEDMGFHGKTITGLQKATKYTAYAYAKSIMGDMVLSPSVTFMTLGFEAFPTSLTFPAEGDTKYVGLSYSEEDITGWDITSKPSWCTINRVDDRMFTVKVDVSTETRNGTIVVTGHSQTLGSVTESVEVTQKVSEIDGDWVDLGLPSGLLWATRNVGASRPEDYGDYFAWGETHPKSMYKWQTYKYGYYNDHMRLVLTKYNTDSYYGNIDNITTLQSCDDAATINWGSEARIPSSGEWDELKLYCSSELTTQNGVYGRRFTASNGNSIFLPAAGLIKRDELEGVGTCGYYWSNLLQTSYPYQAVHFGYYSNNYHMRHHDRCYGCPVRAVRSRHN